MNYLAQQQQNNQIELVAELGKNSGLYYMNQGMQFVLKKRGILWVLYFDTTTCTIEEKLCFNSEEAAIDWVTNKFEEKKFRR